MEFPSKSLLLSLNQDLKIINNINEEITSGFMSIKINSWLYPHKNYDHPTDAPLPNSSGNRLYLSYIELLIDRVYLMLNLFNKYIEQFTKFGQEELSRNVIRPRNLSLGATSQFLWKALKQLQDLVVRLFFESTFRDKVLTYQEVIVKAKQSKALQTLQISESKSTQTLPCSNDECNSCGTASACVKEILKELVAHVDAVCVKKIREELREDIYDKTQQGCMQDVTDAILEDLKTFVNQLKMFEVENLDYKTQVEDLTTKYRGSLKTIRSLERSLKKFRRHNLNVKLKRECLLKRVNELIQSSTAKTNHIQSEAEKTKILEKSLLESSISVALLSTNNDKLQKDLSKSLLEKHEINNEKDLWKKRFGETYLENRKLKQKLETVEPNIDAMNKTISVIHDNCENFMTRLEKTNEKIQQKTELFEKFVKQLKSSRQLEVVGDAPPQACFSSFRITGNPVDDMRQQVALNNSNIQKLERHNSDLHKIINKVQKKTIYT